MLLVVIILSTLAAMIVPRFAGRSEEAKVAAARADIHAHLGSALDLYELDNGIFPASLDALLTDPGNAKKWRGPYLKQRKNLNDPWDRPYQYRCPGTHNPDYDLSSSGPDGQDGTADDITNWNDDKK
jgi:general secretion pathway protein G